jgi:hypothetical protein
MLPYFNRRITGMSSHPFIPYHFKEAILAHPRKLKRKAIRISEVSMLTRIDESEPVPSLKEISVPTPY